MLEKIDLTKKMEKDEYQRRISVLERKLAQLQRVCRNLNIPIMMPLKDLAHLEKEFRLQN